MPRSHNLIRKTDNDSGLQVAAKRGYKVIAIDTGDAKRKMCLDLGAAVFLDFKTEDVSNDRCLGIML